MTDFSSPGILIPVDESRGEQEVDISGEVDAAHTLWFI